MDAADDSAAGKDTGKEGENSGNQEYPNLFQMWGGVSKKQQILYQMWKRSAS